MIQENSVFNKQKFLLPVSPLYMAKEKKKGINASQMQKLSRIRFSVFSGCSISGLTVGGICTSDISGETDAGLAQYLVNFNSRHGTLNCSGLNIYLKKSKVESQWDMQCA